MRVIAIGIAIGTLVAIASGRLINALLFGLVPTDVATIVAAVTVVIAFASGACLIPAWGATHIAPAAALRAD